MVVLDSQSVSFTELFIFAEYAEFKHQEKRYYNFGEVMQEIENETDRLTSGTKGVSATPINLSILSPNGK